MTPRSPHADARRALNDAIRTLYEDTLVPVREIARLAGITERNVYGLVRRLGCRPRMRLAPGGGRRIVPFQQPTNAPLDAESMQQLIQSCERAVQQASDLAADSRASRERRSEARRAVRESQTQARILSSLVHALRDLTVVDGERGRARVARPETSRKRRGYQWKPGLVSPLR